MRVRICSAANPLVLGLVLVLISSSGSTARAAEPDPAAKDQEAIIRVQKILDSAADTSDCAGETTLEKLLLALAKKGGNDFTIRIDEKAFGDDFKRLAEAKVDLPVMKNVSFRTVLRKVLAKVEGVTEVDYATRPSGVVITRPRLASHTMVYDIRDALQEMPFLAQHLRAAGNQLNPRVKPADAAETLVQFLTESVELRSWESVEVHNGSRLVVSASPERQEEVDHQMGALRRLAERKVVMNARLYEVDRAFYTKHVAPLFAKDKGGKDPPAIARIDAALLKKIKEQKAILESDDVKVRPYSVESFLSRHSAYRYATGPADKTGRAPTGSGLAGVSFEVRPRVSADARFLRLEITEKVAQLVGIDKVKVPDPATGKDVQVESPNVRRASRTATVDIPDAGPILMPVSYRPAGKENEDKVWLLVARPFIWIEEEVREIRRTGGDVTPKGIWDSDVPEDEKPDGATPLPFDDKVNP